jgi:ribosomal protein S18 acetylase RimI-like enzyme
MQVVYRPAGEGDLPEVRKLFEEYAASLEIDLAFQGFAAELEGLPGKYAPPRGALILAEQDGEPCGCVALRPIDGQTCEMKRLFVRESGRGQGVGRGLVGRILEEARAKGYAAMRLDTLPSMQGAVRLYRSFGFRDTEPYVYNPIPGAMFMERSLAERQERGGAPRGMDAHR